MREFINNNFAYIVYGVLIIAFILGIIGFIINKFGRAGSCSLGCNGCPIEGSCKKRRKKHL